MEIMKGSVIFVAAFLFVAVTKSQRAGSFCEDDETEVKTRWVFGNGTKCVDKIAEVTDFYNKVYLLECQWWQDLSSPPHSVSKSFVTECFDLRNGTTKYRSKICCPGTVRRQRCFTCSSVAVQYDSDVSKYHSEICNHFTARPTLCNAGEVCQTTLDFNGSRTISKFCAPNTTCAAALRRNSLTCKSGESIPACTYCCEGPFCNYETPLPWHSQQRTRRGCARYPCWNSGTCADDASDPRGYTCACQPGTWGDHCETWMQVYDPCKNEAYIRRTTDEPYYYCYCKAGYKGVNCTEDYDICNERESTYCLNGGTCFDQGQFGLRCRCASGFVGTNCEIKTSTLCAHGSQYFSAGRGMTTSATTNCTERNNGLSLTSYVSSCRSWMGNTFKEGVNGHVARLESMALTYCDRGDRATWYGFDICCPGTLTEFT
ncbi:hypothetical protein LSAT2_029590 [Lamellibrachia satsuma]|nr:hypothetical protein LSAT2_029590 [Lamellibrachia satsuma]